MFRTIVVATDGSDHARHALDLACDLARRYQAALHLVHSPQIDTIAVVSGLGLPGREPGEDEIAAAGKTVMDEALATVRAAGLDGEPHFGNGDPAAEVLRVAEKTGADLIVTGRRGLGGLAGLVLGSTSQRIAHDARCAVLTVR